MVGLVLLGAIVVLAICAPILIDESALSRHAGHGWANGTAYA